ncbi:MAG: MYXO-CTERM sorting domain-containing protein [Phycisphaerales bacterium]
MNALQLRDITPTGVPGGAGLAGLLALGSAGRRRRR